MKESQIPLRMDKPTQGQGSCFFQVSCFNLIVFHIFIFLGGAPTSVCHFVSPSVVDHISGKIYPYDCHLWYTCLK